MDKETIIKLAKEAGWTIGPATVNGLERFANLIAQHERKACFYLVKNYMKETDNMEARGCLASVAYDIKTRGST